MILLYNFSQDFPNAHPSPRSKSFIRAPYLNNLSFKAYIFHKNEKVLLETIIYFYELELISYVSDKCLSVCVHMYVLVLVIAIGIDITVCQLQT